ncbi:MAG: ribonuclease HI [Limisphaerales bacterium]|jgi:ribonuclease HI
MNRKILFTDGSAHPQRRIGIGAFLRTDATFLETEVERIESATVAGQVRTKTFSSTSSTRLEIQTLNWALSECEPGESIEVFTDSQCAVGLASRRERLEANDFVSEAGRPLNNGDVYREFYRLSDGLDVRLQKVEGHSDYRYQDSIQRVFHYVDREARRLLKRLLRELERDEGVKNCDRS